MLAQPAFAVREGRSLLELLGASALWLWERVLELVAWLLPAAEPGTAWSVGRPVVLAALALIAVTVLARAAWWGVGRLRSHRGEPIAGEDGEGKLEAADWSARARAAAAAGRWRDAAVALYQAVLHHLADGGHVRLEPSKTPGDYRREVRGDRSTVEGLTAFVRIFETVAFGADEPDEEAYRRLEARAEPLEFRA